MEGKEKEVNL